MRPSCCAVLHTAYLQDQVGISSLLQLSCPACPACSLCQCCCYRPHSRGARFCANFSGWCQATLLIFHVSLLQLYTSGSTGKPKGVLHTTAGYMMGAGEAVAACTPEWHRQSLCAALLGLFALVWSIVPCSRLLCCLLYQAAL